MSSHIAAAARSAAIALALSAPLVLIACGEETTGPSTPPPEITTTELPDAMVGEPYSESVEAIEGDGEYFWSIASGSLPPGLELTVDDLDQTEAIITGIPETAGSFTFGVEVEDGTGRADTAQLAIEVDAEPGPVGIETPRLPPAMVGQAYEVILDATTGDRESFDWNVVEGAPPPGIQLSADGQFQGAAETTGTSTFTVEVSSGEFSDRQSYSVTAVENDPGGYNITPFPVLDIPPELQDNVAEAIRRWEAAIIGDLEPLAIPTGDQGFPEEACAGFAGLVNGTALDDIMVLINIEPIDGVGEALAQAGPCFVRNSDRTPILGIVILDEDDLQNASTEEWVTDIIQHEIGHALGFGSPLWEEFDLVEDLGTEDPRYVGEEALAAYQAVNDTATYIPLETGGGEGTRDSHWSEEVFDQELLTGFAEQPGTLIYLSEMSIASFADLGYEVDLSVAEDPPAAGLVDPDAEARSNAGYDIVGVGPVMIFPADGTRTFLSDR